MLPRRRFLFVSAAAALVGLIRSAWAAGSDRNTNAFNARSPESALGALDLGQAIESPLIQIDAPDVAENGANVPVEITVTASGINRVLLVGERNVFPLLADQHFGPGTLPWFEIKVKLAETSHVRAYAIGDGQILTASRQVKVIVGGCLPG